MGRSLSAYPYRTLWLWIATLTLIWLALWSPWSTGWNVLCAMLVMFVALLSIVSASRRRRARLAATRHVLAAIDAALGAVPADVKRNMPLVLAVGDAGSVNRPGGLAHRAESSLAARDVLPCAIATAGRGKNGDGDGVLADVFGADLVRITDAAIWVRCDEPTRLLHLAYALKCWRNGQGPDAVAYLIAADRTENPTALTTALNRWRSAIVETGRAVGYRLPVCVALYSEQTHATAEESPWFGISGVSRLQIDTLPTLIASRLAHYTRMMIPLLREPRAYRAAQLDALTRWACEAILPVLCEMQRGSQALKVTAFGVSAIEGRPAPTSLYGRFVTQTTGLRYAAAAGIRLAYPLPESLLRGIARQPARHALSHALAHAAVWLALGFCAAAAASSWQNRALVERVLGDMARYQALAPAQDAARLDALKQLNLDRDELAHYAHFGVPPRLGLGFYRGATLLPRTRTLIASYRPPAPPPSTIELDSLSLFNIGSAVLNPGSNRVLIGALEMIKAHPHKRVLVAGHTDSIGKPESNLKLSEARAAAVRDWLADASGIPITHFAIEAYGDTRPIDPNDTEVGRAANRRVEITLIPDCRDQRDGQSSQGHPACSFE